MENQPLGIVVAKLKGKLNYPPTTSVNTAEDCRLASLIVQMQEWLADQWDWPTLEEWWDLALVSGQRFYNLPTTADDGPQNLAFNKRRELWVQVKWNVVWLGLQYGINETDFNFIDSDIGQTQDPVQRWRYSDTTQMEVWPIPASNYTLRIRGQRVLTSLATGQPYDPSQPLGNLFNATAALDLDDNMVVLFVAAQHFKDQESPLAEDLLQQATAQMVRVRNQEPRREQKIIMGGRSDDEPVKLAAVRIIAVA